MVSWGCRPGCEEAKEAWPGGCQSWVRTTWAKRRVRSLIGPTTASPSGTASAPPGQKSFCTSTTMRTSVSEGTIMGVILTRRVLPQYPARPGVRRRELVLGPGSGGQAEAAVDFGGQGAQGGGDFDRVGEGLEGAQRLGEGGEGRGGGGAGLGEGGGREAAAGAHDGPQQGLAALNIVGGGDDVAGDAAIGLVVAPDLLGARPGGLAGGALATGEAGVGLELVGAVEGGNVGGGGQARADPVGVDGGAGGLE